MIEAFSLKNAHHFGDAMASQARLRYRVFVQHRALPHCFYEDMEYDEYDTPATVYLVWRDPAQIVRGLIRLVPTSMPYMCERHWPEMFESRALPKSDDVWESSRVCIDRTFDSRLRRRIMPELLCAVQEFCLHNGYQAVIGVTRRHLIDHYLPVGVDWVGAERDVEGQREAAFWVPPEHMRPTLHCARYGINGPVLTFEPNDSQRIAA